MSNQSGMRKEIECSLDDRLDRIGRIGEVMGQQFSKRLMKIWRLALMFIITVAIGPICLINGFVNGVRKQ
jgi:hypothetical protein